MNEGLDELTLGRLQDTIDRMVKQSWAYQNLYGQEKAWVAFTPVLTFATPGDVAVTYTRQLGYYKKMGRTVIASVAIVTSAFTHTTAAGALQVTGFPFTSISTAGTAAQGALQWSGLTLGVGYTQVTAQLQAGTTTMIAVASGSAVAAATVTFAEAPTGGAIILRANLTYETTV